MNRRLANIFAAAGLFSVIGAASTWFVYGQEISGPTTNFVLMAVVCAVAWGALSRQQLSQLIRRRAFAANVTSILSILVAAILSVGLYVLADKRDQTWDLTTTQSNSLSNQSLKVLGSIDREIEIIGFFRADSSAGRQFEDFAEQLTQASEHVKPSLIDPIRSPMAVERYGITSEQGAIVIQSGDERQTLTTAFDERTVIQALTQLHAGEKHLICWLVGHGELAPTDIDSQAGLGAVASQLQALNYELKPLPSAIEGVPQQCEAVVIAAPTADPRPYELEALAAYLGAGGNALVLLETGLTPELSAEMRRYGLVPGNDVVLDLGVNNRQMRVLDPSSVVLTGANIRPHPITDGLSAAVVLGLARSLTIETTDVGAPQPILVTSDEAWAETDLQNEPEPTPGEDTLGPVTVMAALEIVNPEALRVVTPPPAVELPTPTVDGLDSEPRHQAVPADYQPKSGGRLVVVGDANFASNGLADWGNNSDLFLNSIAWLVSETDQLGERPNPSETLELSVFDDNMLCIVSVFLVPGFTALLGLLTLVRRRRL